MNSPYNPHQVEQEIQALWRKERCFESTDTDGDDNFYCLAMFPYPSGQLHMGHVRCYTLGDVIGRYQRLQGRQVLQPMGWDAFGLPAENAAIKHGIPPAQWTRSNIDNMRHQMQALGFGIDWTREFATCDPDYYRAEQWFFTKLYERGMVYRKSAIVNWDPVDQTVLANEQVVDGKGWRSGVPVERREMEQWFLKITDYAEELLSELDDMEGWPDSVKSMQRNWIGRSEGVEIDFDVVNPESADERLQVYTTRPDTLLGATYLAVAPEHPIAERAGREDPKITAFIESCKNVKAAEAEMAVMEKRGIATTCQVKHPLSGELLPVWIANFVLMEYGSGAVMSVPAHDQRDWEFAREYGIPIKQVIAPLQGEAIDLEFGAFTDHGQLINSGDFNGLDFNGAFDAIADALESTQHGRRKVNYRLRDWGVSRQRYWGCPIPMIHCPSCGVVPVPEADLPVLLPTDVTFEGVGSPLVNMESFLNVDCPSCHGPARRETDTFDTFMESSWYYARFTCNDTQAPMLDDRADPWLPVDHYVGGIEHAILHLLYARYFHKLMRDLGLLTSNEPFQRLLMLGMVLHNGKKMSKSAGDAGNPQALMDKYGSDAIRMAMMFAAPPEQSFEWNEAGVDGQGRFLRRLWQQVGDYVAATDSAKGPLGNGSSELSEAGRELRRNAHESLSRSEDDYGRRLTFNTVVSRGHELTSAIRELQPQTAADWAAMGESFRILLIILSPIAPHITQKLWALLGEEGLLVQARWPTVDETALVQAHLELVVQVNGKVRGKIRVDANADQEAITALAQSDDNVQRHLVDKTLRKVIYVPGKLVNMVVG